MKLTRGRLVFVLLGLIAIILLGIMIGLQLLIITNSDQSTVANGTPSAQAQPTPALTVALATEAALPPTPTPLPPSPTFTTMPPTFTPAPPTATVESPTATPAPAIPAPTTVAPTTVAVVVVTATATAMPTLAAPTATNTTEAPADLRIGYTERSVDCKFITDIVQLVLERQMKLHIAVLHFKTTDDLFAALASTTGGDRIDLTFCYIDPDDRTYLGNYGSSLRFLDGNYGKTTTQKFYTVINSALIAPLKAEQPCMHNFLKKLDFGDMQFQGKSAAQWLDDNRALVGAWSQCP